MKRLVRLVAAAGALAGVQAIAATPAAAGGYCGYHSYGYYAHFGACCLRYYEVVSRASRYDVVGPRRVYAPGYYRSWRHWRR
jgi:hypothetical protein